MLPVIIQDMIMTLVNNYKYYQKYGAIPFFRPLSKVIHRLDTKDFNKGGVLEKINSLIEYAVRHVPYYQENKEQYKTISSIAELDKLPILKKSSLKEHNTAFISNEKGRFNAYDFRTSGSTGTPITGAISNTDLQNRMTMFLISLKMEGIDYSRPLARFPGADVARSGKVYRRDIINEHLIFSIYHLSHERIGDYHHALNQHKIEILEGYPSTIFSLVRLLKTMGLQLPYVKHVLTTAEKLLDHQREEIEDFFGVKVFDFYGSSEGSVYMFSTKEGYYLNCNQVGYFECVDENYGPVAIGQNGRILVTSFTSHFTPLIRYDIGDYATIISNKDEIIKVSEIHGRQEEIFITPQGKSFGRFSLILKYLPPQVLESQLVLTQGANIARIRYISNAVLKDVHFKEFESKMNSLLEMNFIFEYEQVSKFDKSKRGKLSAVHIER